MQSQETKVADQNFLAYLRDNDYIGVTLTGDGRWVGLFKFLFTWAIIVGRVGDRDGYDDRWCYGSSDEAIDEYAAWRRAGYVGEPKGWKRHPATGRRAMTEESYDVHGS